MNKALFNNNIHYIIIKYRLFVRVVCRQTKDYLIFIFRRSIFMSSYLAYLYSRGLIKDEEIQINNKVKESQKEFYKVSNAGFKIGFFMCEFVNKNDLRFHL